MTRLALPAFRSEAEEGASRRRWAECKEADAAPDLMDRSSRSENPQGHVLVVSIRLFPHSPEALVLRWLSTPPTRLSPQELSMGPESPTMIQKVFPEGGVQEEPLVMPHTEPVQP